MSWRYRYVTVCPNCGLTVEANSRKDLRPHALRASVEAPESVCAAGKKGPEQRLAMRNTTEADARRKAFWDEKNNRNSALPKHLR